MSSIYSRIQPRQRGALLCAGPPLRVRYAYTALRLKHAQNRSAYMDSSSLASTKGHGGYVDCERIFGLVKDA
ncbi:hypothetical protein [Halomonas citrativorans]|uniref:hypothetical protein n=1 Tax=Halomonas citrativorans TaxID=2742612 RepID=UPI001868C843|nr:hypothetical protein [Halomonas citrativorans]